MSLSELEVNYLVLISYNKDNQLVTVSIQNNSSYKIAIGRLILSLFVDITRPPAGLPNQSVVVDGN